MEPNKSEQQTADKADPLHASVVAVKTSYSFSQLPEFHTLIVADRMGEFSASSVGCIVEFIARTPLLLGNTL